MPRWILGIALPLFLCGIARADPSAPPTPASKPADVPALIHMLANPDPDIRRSAERQLNDLGSSVRPALMNAMDTAPPQVRTQLSQILLRRPWVGPRDALAVQQALTDYGQLGADERCQRAQMLAVLPNAAGQDALIRILQFDPSTAVRWQANALLRYQSADSTPPIQRLRDLLIDNHTTNAPLLAAVGWAWHETDAQRTDKILAQAIAADSAHPTAMTGQLDFAYLWLVSRAMEDQRYADAATLLRQQSDRTPWSGDAIPQPISSLFALHAQHGPFPGFVTDLHNCRAYLDQPEILYCLAHLAQQQGLTSTSPILTLAAVSAGGFSPDRHLQSAKFLADQGWFFCAEQECHIALLLCDASSDQPANCYFQLARIAGERSDELATAQNLEAALQHLGDSVHELKRSTPLGDDSPWSDADAWAEVHWHYLRAAQESNDIPALKLHLQKLLDLDKLGQVLHNDPGLASDVIPALQLSGRAADAEKYFSSAYKDLSDQLSAHPKDAEAKNNLAWLCARSNQRLDEAVKLADQAVAAEPDNSAYLDTDAECHFRAGDKTAAVALETRALKLRPADVFLQGQVQRFRGESPHVSSHP